MNVTIFNVAGILNYTIQLRRRKDQLNSLILYFFMNGSANAGALLLDLGLSIEILVKVGTLWSEKSF